MLVVFLDAYQADFKNYPCRWLGFVRKVKVIADGGVISAAVAHWSGIFI